MATSVLRALYLGAGDDVKALVRKHFVEVDETFCSSKEELEAVLVSPAATRIHLVIAGPDFCESCGVSVAELAQSLRMVFRSVPVYYVSDKQRGFDRLVLMKNGFVDAFLLPIDAESLGQILAKQASEAAHRVFSPVKLVDIEPGTRLDFQISLFLPNNNRYITYLGAGDVIDPNRLQRLKQHNVHSVYVPAHQLDEFYSYSARRLRELSTGEANDLTSETERQNKLRESVRELVTGMLSESFSKHIHQGRQVVEHSRKIVRQFILLNNPEDWYMRVINETGKKGDAYSHASSVATYAALFSLIIKEAKPEEMAIAGLFHDVGEALLPPQVQGRKVEQMSQLEFAAFRKHPQLSIESIQARKLLLPDVVLRAILQHHERVDGTGYPEGLSDRRFKPEGQLLAIADTFDELTRVESNVTPLSADQAIRQIELMGMVDPRLMSHLSALFDGRRLAAG